ncbi:MAG TPA: Nif3-like dinuclear metal center hexameric protein [Solirubrobacteraceae bacterium]|jgi:dinuclear metal center YbgI/SA1388 family protein|nr:Nif3-like dinuclear metal center hexameric protein [Solirubrobacteraceae bacterium]
MSAALADLLAELDALLEPQRFADYCPNGLQVPGAREVSLVATGVSASVELFERAIAKRAQLILVHHGLFWGSGTGAIDAAMHRRLKLLFDADVALAAYHLPLDAHPQVGNNALIAQGLGASEREPFAQHEGEPIGVLARFAGAGVSFAELRERVTALTDRVPLVFDAGPERVRALAIVSGVGASYLQEAIDLGADALLTGEPAERAMSHAREADVHFLAAGHYATETFGVRRLGELLRERFDIEHVFVDVPNPI